MFLQVKICISACVGKSFAKCKDPKIVVEKNDISGCIWHRSCIQMVKYYFLDEKNVYQSFYNAPLTFGSFSSRKSCVVCEVF